MPLARINSEPVMSFVGVNDSCIGFRSAQNEIAFRKRFQRTGFHDKPETVNQPEEMVMRSFSMGYIGKSFALGGLGILGTLVACGGGGVTSSVAQNAPASPYVLFASQYALLPGAVSEPYAQTQEKGNVFGFSSGGFGYQWSVGTNPDYLKQRQAYGLQFGHGAPINASSSFGLAVRAPENGTINASASDYLIIQMGNGSATDALPTSHMTFTVSVSGGGNQAVDYTWPATCNFDKVLDADSRPGPSQGAATNPFGLRTYRLPLSSFTCSSGTLATLKADVREIAVKIVGGKDAAASAVAGNAALLQIGMMAFSKQ